MRMHSARRSAFTIWQRQRVRLVDLRLDVEDPDEIPTAILAAAECDLPGEWEQPDFEDDNEGETEADEEDEAGSRSWEHHRPR